MQHVHEMMWEGGCFLKFVFMKRSSAGYRSHSYYFKDIDKDEYINITKEKIENK